MMTAGILPRCCASLPPNSSLRSRMVCSSSLTAMPRGDSSACRCTHLPPQSPHFSLTLPCTHRFPTTLVTDLQDDLVTMARPNMWLCKSQRDARGPAAAAAAGGASGGGGAAAGGAAASGDGAGRLSIFQEQLWRFGTFQSLALLGKK